MTWAFIVVPDFALVLKEAFTNPDLSTVVYSAMFFGFLWGIGGLLFGVSVPYIGLSLTMGIVMGLAGSVGAFDSVFSDGKCHRKCSISLCDFRTNHHIDWSGIDRKSRN